MEIKLVPVREEHLPLLLAWRQDKEIMQYLPTPPVRPTWEQQVAWYRNLKGYQRMIEYEGRPVGIVHYHNEAGDHRGEDPLGQRTRTSGPSSPD